jgi:multimeric flavodoxin WrbA
MARILGIESSARADGLTATLAKECLAGAREAGAETELVGLKGLRIERCRMCNEQGWGQCREAGRCIIEDDFAGLVGKLRAADGLVFATPVYFADLSESMKALVDRLCRITRDEQAKRVLSDKPAVAIAAAGGSGNGTAHCMFQLERLLAACGAFVLDLIPAAQRNRDYKGQVARLAGAALARRAAAAGKQAVGR